MTFARSLNPVCHCFSVPRDASNRGEPSHSGKGWARWRDVSLCFGGWVCLCRRRHHTHCFLLFKAHLFLLLLLLVFNVWFRQILYADVAVSSQQSHHFLALRQIWISDASQNAKKCFFRVQMTKWFYGDLKCLREHFAPIALRFWHSFLLCARRHWAEITIWSSFEEYK